MGWNRKEERGLTLWEVLLALFLTGLILTISLHLMTEQWRGARGLNQYLEAHYAVLTAGKTISDAIRTAESLEWSDNSGVLKVLPLPDDTNPTPAWDAYSLEDLDRDGVTDLYWRHLGVPSPLASYVVRWRAREVEPGLWEVLIEAEVKGKSAAWNGVVRKRMSPISVSPDS